MNAKTIVGLVLVVLGVLALVYQGIPYTTKEEVVNIGPIRATAETEKTLPIHPVFGALILGGGVLLVVMGSRK